MSHHRHRFPGEDDHYRKARDRLLTAEMELRQKIEDVAALRRQLPPGGPIPEDYVFEEADGDDVRQVRFSDLFEGGKDTLVVYSFMYPEDWDTPCGGCTSVTDAADGSAEHLRQRVNFVTVAKGPVSQLTALAQSRGWRHIRFLSSRNNRYNEDYFGEFDGQYGRHHPMLNVFVRRDGIIRHFWASELFFVPMESGHPRHVDLMWPVWAYLDATPEGRNEFFTQVAY